MEALAVWVIDNKEWLFSGVAVAVGAVIYNFLFKKRDNSSTQTIRSGDSSKNIQAGRDVCIGSEKKGNDVGEV